MKTLLRTSAVVSLWLVLAATAASADMKAGGPSSLGEMLAEAELVFLGRVESIDYALSDPTGPENVRIPHTFVTYVLEEVYSGQAPGDTVTLRFMGGLDTEKMRIMSSSNTPQFDVGDVDILFVQGNTRKMCPLVRNVAGRMRIIGDRVYDESGRSVGIDKSGALRFGAKYLLDDIETTTVNGVKFETRRAGRGALSPPGDAMEAAAFKAAIVESAADIRAAGRFVNADKSIGFAGPDMTPAPAPAW